VPFTTTLLAVAPRRRTVATAVCVGLAALAMTAPSFAQVGALPAPPSNSTLDLPLNTGETVPTNPPASRPTAAPARTANGRALPVLSSRGSVGRANLRAEPSKAPSVLASLGLVKTAEVRIRLERDEKSRLLNVVSKGTYLAVVSEMGNHYGVLMVNNTLGWVPKTSLQMIDYQTEVSLPPAPEPEPQPATNAASTTAGLLGSMAGQLDARSHTLLKEAFSYLGVPYVWAGNTRAGLDCSGFVKNVFKTQGVNLPRHSGDQAKVGTTVQWNDLRPGDRLYFDMGRKGRVSHTGIYIGNGYFIHASTNHHCVDVDPLSKASYARALVVAKRDF
jgi:cell wall-associated NlpC family hydrolase